MTTEHSGTSDNSEPSTDAGRAVGLPKWKQRFHSASLHCVRPAGADPRTALVVDNGQVSSSGRILSQIDGSWEVSETLPFPVGFDGAISADGRWVVGLDDDGGSEVGGLVACSVDGRSRVELTPGRAAYVIRGIDFSADGSTLLATIVDDEGFHLMSVPIPDRQSGSPSAAVSGDAAVQAPPTGSAGTAAGITDRAGWGMPRVVWTSINEAWYGHISADGSLLSVDSTDHNPGVRRTAVTVIDASTGAEVAVCNDLPAGPVRAVRFSPVSGDQRILLSTECSGYARPAVWDPMTGQRSDIDAPELAGELQPLDWDPRRDRILALHIDEGIHRLILIDTLAGVLEVVRDGTGSYAVPDVAAEFAYEAQSYLADGGVMCFEQSWARPPRLLRIEPTSDTSKPATIIAAPDVPKGIEFTSEMIPGAEGAPVQLWWAVPRGEVRGTILSVHGGPNLVTNDAYSPVAQAWLDEGFVYAALNYHGSVSFGRELREGFWTGYGDREIADVRAAMERLGEHGIADPESSYITGASYGGHLTLLSLGRLPDLFAGGFAIVAMADWTTAFAEMNAALRPVWETVLSRGELSFEEACYKLSATSYVEQVRGSAVLFQGARDTRTPPAQARKYVDALRAAGGDVLIEWFDAGHTPTGTALESEWLTTELELIALTEAGRRWSGSPPSRDSPRPGPPAP